MNYLDAIRDIVSKIKPGESLTVSGDLLHGPCPPPWTQKEWVLEGILGAAYEFSFYECPETGNITYMREPKPVENGLRTYISADRHDLFIRRPDGLYEPRS